MRAVPEARGEPAARALHRRGALWGLLALGALAAFAGWLYLTDVPGDAAPPARVEAQPMSIAVLPFDNISAGDEHDYLADGIAVELMSSLSRIPALRVASTTASFYFKDRQESLEEIWSQIDDLERTEIEVENFTQYGELFHWPLAAGLLLLAMEVGLGQTVLRTLP